MKLCRPRSPSLHPESGVSRVAPVVVTLILAVAAFHGSSKACPLGASGKAEGGAAIGLTNALSSVSSFGDRITGGWGGTRSQLENSGVTLEGSLVLEGFRNFRGGLGLPRAAGASTFDLSVSIATKRLLNFPGGELYADLEDHAGENPSTSLVGDLQVFDKLNANPYLQLFEFWYQQRLLDDVLRIKIGKIDANTEFSVIDYGLPFINSSTQVSPTVFLFPTTPDPMPGMNVFITPSHSYYLSLGAFYSNSSDRFGDFIGNPAVNQLSKYGGFFIAETGIEWEKAPVFPFAGNLKLGGWEHNGTFIMLNGETQKGTGGVYAILDQTIFHVSEGLSVKTFLEYGLTQRTINPVDEHFGGGATCGGFVPSRPSDLMGLTAQYALVSPAADLKYSYELAVEWFYKTDLTSWGSFMPDLQYIVHPGGEYQNALVGTARIIVKL